MYHIIQIEYCIVCMCVYSTVYIQYTESESNENLPLMEQNLQWDTMGIMIMDGRVIICIREWILYVFAFVCIFYISTGIQQIVYHLLFFNRYSLTTSQQITIDIFNYICFSKLREEPWELTCPGVWWYPGKASCCMVFQMFLKILPRLWPT